MGQVQEIVLLLKYILLGVFQGMTEPLPISSSGHLILLKTSLGVDVPGLSFEIVVHFGSFIAICMVYQQTITRLLTNSLRYMNGKEKKYYNDFNFVLLLLVATLPAGIIGFMFQETISNQLSNITVVGITLIITGGCLWFIRKKIGSKGESQLTLRDGIIIGCAQALALIPGISRSGATIVAALSLGIDRDTALRFSFLLYIPVALASVVFSINNVRQDPFLSTRIIPFMIACIASLIATFFALKWFMNIMKQGKLGYFAYYCIIVGVTVLLWFT